MKKILFCGGGTLGPVTPLLAIAEAWQKQSPKPNFVFVGTPHGPERELVEKFGMDFKCLPEAKLRRYPSVEWLWLPFRLLAALCVAWRLLKKEKPSLIVSAGGYTAVPLIVIGWFLNIPSWVHQQDIRPLLSNKLSAPFASFVTVAWKESLKDFPESKTKFIGNPVRQAFVQADRQVAIDFFHLDLNKPTILILGGGTGSLWLNKVIGEVGAELAARANIIHLTGKGKLEEVFKNFGLSYQAFELLTSEMPLAFAAADVVVCRAGLGTITELAATKKPAIIIPLPNSPQEENAAAVEEASVVLFQPEISGRDLFSAIVSLLDDQVRREDLGKKIGLVLRTNVAGEMVELAEKAITNVQRTRSGCC